MKKAMVRGLAILAASALTWGATGGAAAVADPAHAGTNVVGTGLVPVTSRPATARLAALGPMSAGQRINGLVALRLRDEPGLATVISDATDPRSSNFGHYLSPSAFDHEFAPPRAAVARVTATLRADGLTVNDVSGNDLLVAFTGRAATVERAFHTSIERYRLSDGRAGFATTASVRLPASLASTVSAVVGLDDLVSYRSQLVRRPSRRSTHSLRRGTSPTAITGAPHACAGARSQLQYNAVTDDEIARAYGVDGLYADGDLGAGQTVDIFELEPFFKSDVKAFDECYFGVDHTSQVEVQAVDGGAGVGEGSGEAALDVENVSAIAPDARINVYEAPNSTVGSLDDYDAMVVADNSRVISTSWGLCETAFQAGAPGTQAIENSIFMEAAAQGQSIFAAAGDDGSDDCANQDASPVATDLSVDDPGSQPYVVSVGGTSFLDASEPPDETVWNDGNTGGAGGGGVSETWAMPAWQQDTGVPGVTDNAYASSGGSGSFPYRACSNDPGGAADDEHLLGSPTTLAPGTLCREVPDVTALADEDTGITVYDGGWTNFGGTSSSAPLWAAMTAEMNASSFCAPDQLGVGFVSPILYQVADNPTSYAQAFNDVTAGDNDSLDVGTDLPLGAAGNTYAAGTGYDLASGLGSPRLTDADGDPGLAQLACGAAGAPSRPAVTSVTPPYGSASGGTTVTIDGSGFGAAMGHVQFGDVPVPAVDIESWGCAGSACSITLATPPFFQAASSDGPPGGAVTVSVIAAGAVPAASAPSPLSTFHYLASGATGAPVVEYVGPAAGPDAGGTTVHLIGSGFADGTVTGVTFGGVPGTDVHVLSDGALTARTPSDLNATCSAGSSDAGTGACQTEVVVTTTIGSSMTSTLLPAYRGPFVLAPSEIFVPPTHCGCEVVPAMTEFDYAPPPSIRSITPTFGNAVGPRVETIEGTGFNLLTYEWTNFGPADANLSQDFNLVAIGPSVIQVESPPIDQSVGKVGPLPTPMAVSVQTLAGVAVNGRTSPFAYAGVPVVTSISHPFGPTIGGQRLTIAGKGFSDATSVRFVSQIPSPYGVQYTSTYLTPYPTSGSDVTITTPAGQPGPNDVEVCSATACSAPRPADDAYVYDYPGQPVVLSSAPTRGPASGGTRVTIRGRLLGGVRAVYFGARRARSWRSGPSSAPEGSTTEVIAVAPRGAPGTTVSVTVLTDGSASRSPVSLRARFTYSSR